MAFGILPAQRPRWCLLYAFCWCLPFHQHVHEQRACWQRRAAAQSASYYFYQRSACLPIRFLPSIIIWYFFLHIYYYCHYLFHAICLCPYIFACRAFCHTPCWSAPLLPLIFSHIRDAVAAITRFADWWALRHASRWCCPRARYVRMRKAPWAPFSRARWYLRSDATPCYDTPCVTELLSCCYVYLLRHFFRRHGHYAPDMPLRFAARHYAYLRRHCLFSLVPPAIRQLDCLYAIRHFIADAPPHYAAAYFSASAFVASRGWERSGREHAATPPPPNTTFPPPPAHSPSRPPSASPSPPLSPHLRGVPDFSLISPICSSASAAHYLPGFHCFIISWLLYLLSSFPSRWWIFFDIGGADMPSSLLLAAFYLFFFIFVFFLYMFTLIFLSFLYM